jgi:iron uptake system EfeUOB component EfeO/EfeM
LVRALPAAMVAKRVEPYAQDDLVEVAALLEGAEAAFEAVKPRLRAVERPPVRRVEAQFGKAFGKLSSYGTLAREPVQAQPDSPGAVFILFSDLSDAEIRETAGPIAVLGGLLSRAAAQPASG